MCCSVCSVPLYWMFLHTLGNVGFKENIGVVSLTWFFDSLSWLTRLIVSPFLIRVKKVGRFFVLRKRTYVIQSSLLLVYTYKRKATLVCSNSSNESTNVLSNGGNRHENSSMSSVVQFLFGVILVWWSSSEMSEGLVKCLVGPIIGP